MAGSVCSEWQALQKLQQAFTKHRQMMNKQALTNDWIESPFLEPRTGTNQAGVDWLRFSTKDAVGIDFTTGTDASDGILSVVLRDEQGSRETSISACNILETDLGNTRDIFGLLTWLDTMVKQDAAKQSR